MGVSGSGKSTVGAALATRFGYCFVEGDDLHSPGDIAQMRGGHPLSDAQRAPWLRAVGERLVEERARRPGVVAACSALRRAYRDLLRSYVPDAYFVELDAPPSTLRERMAARRNSFMPVSLLESQLATLEPLQADELGTRIDVDRDPTVVIDELIERLDHRIAT
jgi:gluconokinase